MNLQDQIEYCQGIEKRFLDLDHYFLRFEAYEGEHGEDADKMGHVIESLWRLQELEH